MIVHGGQQSAGRRPRGISGRCIHFKPVSPSLKPEVTGYCRGLLRPVRIKSLTGDGKSFVPGSLIIASPCSLTERSKSNRIILMEQKSFI